ncbi:recombinase family protein [Chroococcidiopsis sp. SAG 2025]|uniref:recombinase family protein n=1 Tax=Chroococcidiopsis sp. SAG 2025 TaxID=171389 RepID=UPI003977448A
MVGSTRSGKTTRLVEQFCTWLQAGDRQQSSWGRQRLYPHQGEPAVLVLAANDDNRRELRDKLAAATDGKYPIRAKTLLGFFQDEVTLFWPLLLQILGLKAQFPVRLRPETEQELATRLWRQQLDEIPRPAGIGESRWVRRLLDILQLAANSGTAIEDVGCILAALEEEQRSRGAEGAEGAEGEKRAKGTEGEKLRATSHQPLATLPTPDSLILNWRNWCWERGFLTYGITTELYSKYLLGDPYYQQHLLRRYRYILADDVDDYPAIARDLFEFLLDRGAVGAFTYNPDGAVRLGLGADPEYLQGLAKRCQIEFIQPSSIALADDLATPVVELVTEPLALFSLPESVQAIQTISRGDLLRQTADFIIQAIKSGQIQPQEIALIAPGLDAIARYTLVEILTKHGIFVESLNDQRPLTSSPIIRALLTLLTLVYPGLGRLVDRDMVAEMLVVLSTRREAGKQGAGGRELGEQQGKLEEQDKSQVTSHKSQLIPNSEFQIDPVRAGLIADYCFQPHPEHPNLLPATTYDRWDRLGYAASLAYAQIVQWIEDQRSQQEQRLLPSPIVLLDRAIQKFLWQGSNLPYDQLAALRELLETAQHYWEIDARLRQSEGIDTPAHTTIAQFIQLLRRGTITANSYPVRPIGAASRAVTLATIFQYRSSRRFHRWQFWLDAGSPLWSRGGAATLYGAPLFLQHRFGRPWTAEDDLSADTERLRRILRDLLGRVGERVYLCHSDLAANGQEQNGTLLSLVNSAIPVIDKS